MSAKKLNIKTKVLLDCQKKIGFIEKSLSQLSPDHKRIVVEESVYSSNLFLIRDMKGSAQTSGCHILSTLCSVFEDQLPFLVNQDSVIDDDVYCKLFIVIKLIKEYVTLNLTDSYDEVKFKENYNEMLFLKDLDNTDDSPILNKSELRVLFVSFPNSLLKQVGNSLKHSSNILISTSNSVQEALYRVKNEYFDVVVSSYIMEPMNGLTLSVTLKQQYKEKAPYFILNPSDNISDLEDTPKKYQPDAIFLRNEDLYNQLKTALIEVQEKKLNYSGNTKNKILFIDDNEYVIESYKMICSMNDSIVPFFNYGRDVSLDFIEKISPNLIMCDICMPEVDVKSLLKEIKSHPILSHVPIVFITGNKNMPICKELSDLGATAILEKSFLKPSFFEDLIQIKIKL